ncbi:MAG: leucine-rich repeat domain-containing protein [Bacteroidales bacterium]|nr:leucine-rich repeat domain-containing protein [Bacteroidales bacterium]
MKRFLYIASFLLLLSSCGTEVVEEPLVSPVLADGNFSLTMLAELPELPVLDDGNLVETKASTQYTVRIKWAAGDKLSVINLTTGKLLGGYMTANSSGTSTTFSGSLQGTVNNGDLIAYFYPAQENDTETVFSGFTVDMSSQKGTTGAVPLCVYSVVEANGDTFQNAQIYFSYLMSYIMIGMSDIPASARLKSVRISNVTNCFSVTSNEGRTGLDIIPQQGDISLVPDNQSASSTGVKTVYAAIPESSSSSRKIYLETETNLFETAFTSAKLQNGYAYNTNVSGFLDDDLSFKDSRLRQYCLQQFDSNADGKLSMVEIAGVTAFPAALPAGILSFNELEYFYGLTTLPSFENQANLSSITIPRQITSIPNGTFAGCGELVELYLKPTTPPALGSGVFDGTPENMMLIVPDDSLSDYQSAAVWRDYAEHIRGTSTLSGSGIRIKTEGDKMGSENVNVNVE